MQRLALILMCVIGFAAAAFGVEGPNVVLILADDMGYADLSCYGSERVKTPNIDKLAEQGVRLTQFYAAAPECTPTRTALLTGRYPQRAGGLECAIGVNNVGRYDDAIRLAQQHDLGLPAAMNVLPSALKANGYRNALTGKWHLGYEEKFNPLHHGFEYFIGVIGGNADYFHHVESSDHPTAPGNHVLFRGDKPYHDDRYMTHLITQEATDWLKRMFYKDRFFLYVAYTAPHTPLQGPGDRKDKPLTGGDFNRGTPEQYRQLIEEMDKGVGEILDALKYFQLENNTIVIFTSDNGSTKMGETQPFSGTKSTVYEGGIRVPCIIRWPKKIKPGTTSDQVAITMDLTHSILKHTGIDVSQHKLDGIDIIGHIMDGKEDESRTLFWRYRRGERTRKAVRDGDLKLIDNLEGDEREVKLFDLSADKAEKNDLSQQRPEEVKRLSTLLSQWEEQVKPAR